MLSRWSIRSRLVALTLCAAVVSALLGAAALWAIQRVANDMGAVQERRLIPLTQLDVIGRGLERQRAGVLATLAATNDVMVEALEKQLARDAVDMPRSLAALRDGATIAAERAAYDAFAAALAKSRTDGLAAALAFLRKGQFIEADVASQTRYRPQMDAASRALDELIRVQVSLAAGEHAAAQELVRELTAFLVVAALVALALGLALVLAISRTLDRTLGAHESELAEGAARVARGELQFRIATREDDHASVAANLNSMSRAFSELVSGVAQGAQRVLGTAGRLSEGSRALSARTVAQAASLEQTAASMQQLAATVRQNADRVERARALAVDASQVAGNGGKAVADAASTMRELAQSSQRIREIVGTIDGIAFQTNLLALNAAVEAARAGDHGRGFAVVAAEVRALSRRSADAAKQIRTLSEESIQQNEKGAGLAVAAADTMRGIVASAGELSGIVDEIAGASREQAAGLGEVNRAVEQLDKVTQSNAALAEQADADAAALSAEAEALVAALARFVPEERAPDEIRISVDRARSAQSHPPRRFLAPSETIESRIPVLH